MHKTFFFSLEWSIECLPNLFEYNITGLDIKKKYMRYKKSMWRNKKLNIFKKRKQTCIFNIKDSRFALKTCNEVHVLLIF